MRVHRAGYGGMGAGVLAALLLHTTPAFPQRPGDSVALRIPRVTEAPKLEWFLGAPRGAHPGRGVPVTGFRQRKPGDGTPVTQRTTAYLSYDDDRLYVVFVCKDDPAGLRANVSRREDIWTDDAVGIYLDTFLDHKRAYMFEVNPRGVQLDGIMTEGQDYDYTFDAVWDSEGRLTADGYVVRIAIPFRSLRFPRRAAQVWGLALKRTIRRNSEEAYWPLVTKRIQGVVGQFAEVQGLSEVSPGRNMQVLPYGMLARARTLDKDALAYRSERDQRPGVDAKVVLGGAFTLDGTVNPDFSQVESDDPQVTVNQRFEVFFPEKRPFFLENAGYFQTPIDLLFSRRIVDPGVGGRFTGKAGRWAVGAIGINDRAPGRLDPTDPMAGRRAGIGVLRLQRELGRESGVGLLISDREFGASYARAVSVDSRLKLAKNWAATAQVVRTGTRELEEPGRSGWGWQAAVERNGRHLDYSAKYLNLGADFSAPLGFVQRSGIQQMKQDLQYTVRPRSRFLLAFGPLVSVKYVWDQSGRMLDRELTGELTAQLTGETDVKLARAGYYELFEDRAFAPDATELSVSTEWFKWLGVKGKREWGTAVNHDPADGVEPFLGRFATTEIGVQLRPASWLRWENTYLDNRLSLDGAPVFTERRWRTKVGLQINRNLSLRTIVDYKGVVPDSTLSSEDHERRWFADYLLTYLLSPGTALYVGYTDRLENFAVFPGPPPELRRTGSPSTSVGRQFFVKVSYLLRF